MSVIPENQNISTLNSISLNSVQRLSRENVKNTYIDRELLANL